MDLSNITPLILSYNEERNIGRVLDNLELFVKIIIVDSYSTDSTIQIIQSYKNIELHKRKFDNHTNQWNYGLDLVKTDWVLSLDADYVISETLQLEMSNVVNIGNYDGYYIPFKYLIFGKALRASILPPRLALFRKDSAIYIQDGHTQILQLNGKAGPLQSPILHDDRKSLDRWLWAQSRYAKLEVSKLTNNEKTTLSFNDKVRKKILLAPFLVLIYCLIVKRGIFDGWRGWFYAFQRMYAELLLSLKLIEKKFLENN